MTSCISTMNVIAQDKKSFTLEDLMPGGNIISICNPRICMD